MTLRAFTTTKRQANLLRVKAAQADGHDVAEVERLIQQEEHCFGKWQALMIQEGMPMPKTGRPHYEVARAFVRCALGVEIDVESAVKKNPNLQYMSWGAGNPLGRPKRTGK